MSLPVELGQPYVDDLFVGGDVEQVGQPQWQLQLGVSGYILVLPRGVQEACHRAVAWVGGWVGDGGMRLGSQSLFVCLLGLKGASVVKVHRQH